MDRYEQITYKGHHINIYYDESPESPREWDNLGTFYTAHRRYRPEKDFDSHFDFDKVCDHRPGNLRESFLEKYIALNIYLYDHSGLTISSGPFSCPWDSGWFGIVAVSIEKVKKEYGWKMLTKSRRKKIEQYLQGEIDTYDQYLRGEVYGFQITPENDDTKVLDSCWGFYGNDGIKEIKSECLAYIDAEIAYKEEQKREERIRLFGLEIPFPEFALSIN